MQEPTIVNVWEDLFVYLLNVTWFHLGTQYIAFFFPFYIILYINFSPATWYAITGIILGCLAFVVGMSVLAYKCYRRYGGQRSGRGGQNRLSSAIKKGLKEQNNSSMKKSPVTSGKSSGGRGSMSGPPVIQVCDRKRLLIVKAASIDLFI